MIEPSTEQIYLDSILRYIDMNIGLVLPIASLLIISILLVLILYIGDKKLKFNIIILYVFAISSLLYMTSRFEWGLLPVIAALIGAGPPLVYQYYKEKVDTPNIVRINGDIKYIKTTLGNVNGEICLPVINIFVPLENKGEATANSCFGKIGLPNHSGNFYGRWNGEGYSEEKNLHPNLSDEIIIGRIYIQEESVKEINTKLKKKNSETRIDYESADIFNFDNKEIHAFCGDLKLCFQTPSRKEFEDFIWKEKHDNTAANGAFYGRYTGIEMFEDIRLQIGSENYHNEIKLGDISSSDALSCNWRMNVDIEQDLEEILDDMGWTKRNN